MMTHHLWIAPLVALALAQLPALATSIYLHRALAHRALVLHPVTDVCFRTMLWLTTGQKRREWVAVHRKHHTFTDQEGDPSSPRLFGFWRIPFLNLYYFVMEHRKPASIRTFASDIREDWWCRLIFSRGLTGVVLVIVMLCLIFGAWV